MKSKKEKHKNSQKNGKKWSKSNTGEKQTTIDH